MSNTLLMRCMVFLLTPVFLSLLSAPARAECPRPSIKECPSFYKAKCIEDSNFRLEDRNNARACMKILAGKAKDKQHCAEIDTSSCSEPKPKRSKEECKNIDNTKILERYNCESGFPQCPGNIYTIKKSFNSVLSDLNTALDSYKELIVLDLGKVDLDTLCKYKSSKVKELQSKSEIDNEGFESQKSELNLLIKCNELANTFTSTPLPPAELKHITTTLWAQAKSSFSTQLEEVNQQQGAVNSQLSLLKQAPEKIRTLSAMHNMMCPPSD